jgi:hypothetical protein
VGGRWWGGRRERGPAQGDRVGEGPEAEPDEDDPPRHAEGEGGGDRRRGEQRPHRVDGRGAGVRPLHVLREGFDEHHVGGVGERARSEPVDGERDQQGAVPLRQPSGDGGDRDGGGAEGEQHPSRPDVAQQRGHGFHGQRHPCQHLLEGAHGHDAQPEGRPERRGEDDEGTAEQLVGEAGDEHQRGGAVGDVGATPERPGTDEGDDGGGEQRGSSR